MLAREHAGWLKRATCDQSNATIARSDRREVQRERRKRFILAEILHLRPAPALMQVNRGPAVAEAGRAHDGESTGGRTFGFVGRWICGNGSS